MKSAVRNSNFGGAVIEEVKCRRSVVQVTCTEVYALIIFKINSKLKSILCKIYDRNAKLSEIVGEFLEFMQDQH